MARKKRTTQQKEVQDYRHDTATRKNNPPAGIAAQGKINETPKQEYVYNPHLPPNLRSDPNGDADKLPELLQIAQQRALSADEAKTLADALRHHSPWLEWAGKQETKSFAVDPVALHIHERVSAKAILKVAERQNVQRELFADPQQDYSKAVDFYQHDVDWANRLILGDSLTVMSSLAHREDLAGKVQMIYIDPPYGIKYASNFQPTVFQRDVKDRKQDLTREQEQIRAYRDTWTLGIHSYLAYLRDRLIASKDLLTDTGSIFVQISDENLHRVRCIMDEVFGSENFISQITYKVTSGFERKLGPRRIQAHIIWYAKQKELCKFRRIFKPKNIDDLNLDLYKYVEQDGSVRTLTNDERTNPKQIPNNVRIFMSLPLHTMGTEKREPREFEGEIYTPPSNTQWRHTATAFDAMVKSKRIIKEGSRIRSKYYLDDLGAEEYNNVWLDTGPELAKSYVVQTAYKVVQRCLLMTTDPGDLVLDPTCGSGTTAYVAEQWGRRWITIDTSRVAVTLARQRLLTAVFNYYQFKNESKGIAGGFINKIIPRVTLKDIGQNTALDPIFAKHEPILKEKLDILNNTLTQITPPPPNSCKTPCQTGRKRETRGQKIYHRGR